MTRAKAISHGKQLLSKMKGKGWSLKLWNHGEHPDEWHFHVISNGLKVYDNCYECGANVANDRCPNNGSCRYHCDFGHGNVGGDVAWGNHPEANSCKDPNEAVRLMLRLARNYVNNQNKLVTRAEKAMKGNI